MSENQIFSELERYNDQLDALLISNDWEQNQKGKENTKTFYKENIERLRKQCHEVNPKRLSELDKRRENDCPVNEAEEIC